MESTSAIHSAECLIVRLDELWESQLRPLDEPVRVCGRVMWWYDVMMLMWWRDDVMMIWCDDDMMWWWYDVMIWCDDVVMWWSDEEREKYCWMREWMKGVIVCLICSNSKVIWIFQASIHIYNVITSQHKTTFNNQLIKSNVFEMFSYQFSVARSNLKGLVWLRLRWLPTDEQCYEGERRYQK